MKPARWIVARIGAHGALLVALIGINFALPRLMPGDPLSALLTPGSAEYLTDPGQQDQLRAFYGLDRPWPEHLRDHLLGLLTGDLGTSLHFRLPVSELIGARLVDTGLLIGGALLLGTLAGTWLGAVAGWHQGSGRDLGIVALVAVLRGVPPFFIAAVLQHVFAVQARWFPVFGARTEYADAGPLDVLHHLVLPVLALAAAFATGQVLIMRAQVATEKSQPHVLAARARGLPTGWIRRHHVNRNAWRPMLAVLGVQAGVAIGAVVLVEQVFAYPGVGSLLVEGIDARDYPLVQGCFLLMTCLVLLCAALADIARGLLDPRTVAA